MKALASWFQFNFTFVFDADVKSLFFPLRGSSATLSRFNSFNLITFILSWYLVRELSLKFSGFNDGKTATLFIRAR